MLPSFGTAAAPAAVTKGSKAGRSTISAVSCAGLQAALAALLPWEAAASDGAVRMPVELCC